MQAQQQQAQHPPCRTCYLRAVHFTVCHYKSCSALRVRGGQPLAVLDSTSDGRFFFLCVGQGLATAWVAAWLATSQGLAMVPGTVAVRSRAETPVGAARVGKLAPSYASARGFL